MCDTECSTVSGSVAPPVSKLNLGLFSETTKSMFFTIRKMLPSTASFTRSHCFGESDEVA